MRPPDTQPLIDTLKYQVVDFLRGYAILAIVIYHYLDTLGLQSPFNKLIRGGGTGVHVFVLLSGFGLYASHARRPLTYFSFIAKRLVKICVPYYIVVTISALISLFIPIFQNSLYAYFGHLFFYKMFDERIVGSYGYPLWFISMILQFYLCFHLFAYIKNRLSKDSLFFLIFLGISILWAILVIVTGHSSEKVWSSFFLQYSWEFVLGMIIADHLVEIRDAVKHHRQLHPHLFLFSFLLTGMVGILIYGGLALCLGDAGRMVNDIPALFGFSAVGLFLYLVGIKRLNILICYIGAISFSLYLLHTLVIELVQYYLPPSIISIAIAFVLSILLSMMFHHYVNNLTSSVMSIVLRKTPVQPSARTELQSSKRD